MQCKERNRLARGDAGTRERAYKVACAVPIRNLVRSKKENENKKITEV